MQEQNKYALLRVVVLLTLFGSIFLAVLDPAHRKEFMRMASSSLGAYWALQKPTHKQKKDDDE